MLPLVSDPQGSLPCPQSCSCLPPPHLCSQDRPPVAGRLRATPFAAACEGRQLLNKELWPLVFLFLFLFFFLLSPELKPRLTSDLSGGCALAPGSICGVIMRGFDVPARLPGSFCSNYSAQGRRAPCRTKGPGFDVWARRPFSGRRHQEPVPVVAPTRAGQPGSRALPTRALPARPGAVGERP